MQDPELKKTELPNGSSMDRECTPLTMLCSKAGGCGEGEGRREKVVFGMGLDLKSQVGHQMKQVPKVLQ